MKKFLISIFILFFSGQVLAQDFSEKDVGDFVDKIGNKIVTIANKKASEKVKKDEIIKVLDDAIDSNWIARFVLSRNYRIASKEQRAEFMELYRQFMINTYGPKFKNYNGRKFSVNQVIKQRSFYLVKAEFLPRDSNVAVSVDFRVKENHSKLVVLDFIAEGISLIETQRSEFNSAISKHGIAGFLKILDERVKKLQQ